MANRFSVESKAEMLDCFMKDVPVSLIAQEFGCSEPTVRLILKEQGIEFSRPGRPSIEDSISPESLEELLKEYSSTDESAVKIAERWGISVTKLFGLLAKYNIPTRNKTPEMMTGKKSRMDLAMAMYQNHDIFVWEITKETGYSSLAIIEEVHKRDIPMRRPFTRRK